MVGTALKNQLVSILEDAYMSPLKNEYTGYNTKTTLELVTHMYSRYAQISDTEMLENDENLHYRYNAEEPPEYLI